MENTSGYGIDLILVNDGSTRGIDESHLSFLESQIKNLNYIKLPLNKGKGFALRAGVQSTKTELSIYTDIDFPYTKESFLGVLNSLEEGSDVVSGHRGTSYYKKTPWFRKLISKSLRWTLKTFLRLPTDDTQCGIKGFNSKGKNIFLETNIDRFLFDLEFIKLASKRKLTVKPCEVQLKPNVVFSKVGISILVKESVNFVKILFRK